jgi:anti-sigma B factor antagonist
LEIKVDERSNCAILKITGDVDLYSSPQVRSQIINLVNNQQFNLLVDFTDVTYMDSSGVATLVEALQMTHRNHGKLRLFNMRQAIRDVFELSRLDKVFEIYDNEELATQGI